MDNQILKQELAIFFKKVVSVEGVVANQRFVEDLEAAALRVEFESSRGPYNLFFLDFQPILEHIFLMKNEKIDFLVVEFMERCLNKDILFLCPAADAHRVSSRPWKAQLMHQSLSETILRHLCALYQYKNVPNYPRLTKLILKMFLDNFNSFTTNISNKILCAFFIAHFDSARQETFSRVNRYTLVATKTIIQFSLDKLRVVGVPGACKFIQIQPTTSFSVRKRAGQLASTERGGGQEVAVKERVRCLIKPDSHIYCRNLVLFLANKACVLAARGGLGEIAPPIIRQLRMPWPEFPGFSAQTLEKKVGACFICQKSSSYYHMEEQLPICGIYCKLELDRLLCALDKGSREVELVDLYENRNANTILTYLFNLAVKKPESPSEANPFGDFMLDLIGYFLKKSPEVFFMDPKNEILTRQVVRRLIYDKVAGEDLGGFNKGVRVLWRFIKKGFHYFLEEIHWLFTAVVLPFMAKETGKFQKKLLLLDLIGKFLGKPHLLATAIANFDLGINFDSVAGKLLLFVIRSTQVFYLSKSLLLTDADRVTFKKAAIKILEKIVRRFNEAFEIVRSRSAFAGPDNASLASVHDFESEENSVDRTEVQSTSTTTLRDTIEEFISVEEFADSKWREGAFDHGQFWTDFLASHSQPGGCCASREKLSDFVGKMDQSEAKKQLLESFLVVFREKTKKNAEISGELECFRPGLTLPRKVATLVLQKKVSKVAAGEFFSGESILARDAFFELASLLKIENDRIDVAFRKVLKCLTLPYVSEKVNKVLLLFGEAFNKHSAGVVSKDCAYGTVYLMIMVQSELHNPLVIEKMTLKQFMGLAVRVPDFNQFLTEGDVREIYNSISEKPLDWSDKSRQEKREIRGRTRSSKSLFSFSFFKESETTVEDPLKKLLAPHRHPPGDSPTPPIFLDCHHQQFAVLHKFFKAENGSVLVVNLLMAFSDQEEQQLAIFGELTDLIAQMLVNLGESDSLLQLLLGLVKNSEVCSANAKHVFTPNNIFAVQSLFRLSHRHFLTVFPFFGPRLHSFLNSFARFAADDHPDDPFLSQNAAELRKRGVVAAFWKLKELTNGAFEREAQSGI